MTTQRMDGMTTEREMLITIVGKYYGALTQTAIEDITDAILAADFRLVTPPGKDVVEGARAVVRQHICEGSFEEMQDDLAHSIAAFATACVAKETERHRAEVECFRAEIQGHVDTITHLRAEVAEYERVKSFACKTIAEISPDQRADQGNVSYGIIGLITTLRAEVEQLTLIADEREKKVESYRNNALDFQRTLAIAEAQVAILTRERDKARADKDSAYFERNNLVAALARIFPSGIRATKIPGWSPDWHGCVYIDLPSGQISYHYHDSHAQLFAGLPPYTKEWDGHDKDEVHRRLTSAESDLAAAQKRVDVLEPLLQRCADELQAEINARYMGLLEYPSNQRKYKLDMEAVNNARAALKESGNGDETVRPDQQGEKR